MINRIIFFILLAIQASAFLLQPGIRTVSSVSQESDSVYLDLFNKYLTTNGKSYATADEYLYRFNIFKAHLRNLMDREHDPSAHVDFKGDQHTVTSLKMVVTQGLDPCKFKRNLNKFADLSDEEFNRYYLLPPKFFDESLYEPRSVLDFEEETQISDKLNYKLNDDNYDVFTEVLTPKQGNRPCKTDNKNSESDDIYSKLREALVRLLEPKRDIFNNMKAKETGLDDICISYLYKQQTQSHAVFKTADGTLTRKVTKTITVKYDEQAAPGNFSSLSKDFPAIFMGRKLQSYPTASYSTPGYSNMLSLNYDYSNLPQSFNPSYSQYALPENRYTGPVSANAFNFRSREQTIGDRDIAITNSSRDSSTKKVSIKPIYSGGSSVFDNHLPQSAQDSSQIMIGGVSVPSYLDWRDADIISPIKDQNNCKGCYAFSAIAALEANNALHNDDFTRLSEQEVVDCSEENDGCEGGLPSLVFDYVKKKGISSEKEYPYKNLEEAASCTRKSRGKKFSAINGYVFVKKGVLSLIKALQFGPVATLSYASNEFKYYDSGVYDGEGCDGMTKPNHSSLVVGYNLQTPKPYFILKNAWGIEWGDNGIYKMSIGPLSDDNLGKCLLASTRFNVFPVIKKMS